MTFLRRYKWHFLFWLVYFVFWTEVSIRSSHTPLALAVLVTLSWAIGQGTLNYYSIYRLIPRYFHTRRYGIFTLLLAAGIVLSTFSVTGLQVAVFRLARVPMPYPVGADLGYVALGNLYAAFVVLAIKSIRDMVRNNRRTQLLEKEKTANELRFLRSQMNPHFLFNAINSIYVLIRKDPELASHTLLRFADMLRYQLYDCNADRIPIEKEIVYLDNYIGLEKLRKGSMVCTEYEVGPEVRNFSIAPLLIIPFVENAFKFVSAFTDRANQVAVRLRCRDGSFELSVVNTIDAEAGGAWGAGGAGGIAGAFGGAAVGGGVRDGASEPGIAGAFGGAAVGGGDGASGGIGLENVRRRLELIYSGRHSLDIQRDRQRHSVQLKIPVQ
ncbi:MAG TPA: histidine kinase [Puia sp.]|nr:histidine kinase [Puia sp.]